MPLGQGLECALVDNARASGLTPKDVNGNLKNEKIKTPSNIVEKQLR